MRYLRGGSLLAALQTGPWRLERAAAMLEQVAGALSAAHRMGVVHRDIKPGNILLDEAGNAYRGRFWHCHEQRAPDYARRRRRQHPRLRLAGADPRRAGNAANRRL
jgi:serine/threonine protein kinase